MTPSVGAAVVAADTSRRTRSTGRALPVSTLKSCLLQVVGQLADRALLLEADLRVRGDVVGQREQLLVHQLLRARPPPRVAIRRSAQSAWRRSPARRATASSAAIFREHVAGGIALGRRLLGDGGGAREDHRRGERAACRGKHAASSYAQPRRAPRRTPQSIVERKPRSLAEHAEPTRFFFAVFASLALTIDRATSRCRGSRPGAARRASAGGPDR